MHMKMDALGMLTYARVPRPEVIWTAIDMLWKMDVLKIKVFLLFPSLAPSRKK